jgi:hypothetical protein
MLAVFVVNWSPGHHVRVGGMKPIGLLLELPLPPFSLPFESQIIVQEVSICKTLPRRDGPPEHVYWTASATSGK